MFLWLLTLKEKTMRNIRCFLVTPNRKELREAVGLDEASDIDPAEVAKLL